MDRANLATTGADAVSGQTTMIDGFETMFECFGPEIHRFSLRLTRNGADADDLYQETFLRAFRAYDRLDAEANHRAWLYRIATNTFLSGRRKLNRIEALDDELPIAAPSHDHAAQLDARSLLRDVETFIAELPAKQRVALTLRKYHELGYAEIAEVLHCSEAAARANVHEGLRKVRTRFGDRLQAVTSG
ncbi:MAG: RNA polymerase sigma factor [Thermomicrobiales bacterium]|nr:RNA polymerase sigma factor [Thermomicrobiales bacterium]